MLYCFCSNAQIVVNIRVFNLSSINMKHVLKGVSLCVMFGLSSCHTTLYNAAKEGDVETVRQELAAGVPMNKSASKANLIWQIPTALITVPLDVVQVAGVPLLVTPIAYTLIAGEN